MSKEGGGLRFFNYWIYLSPIIRNFINAISQYGEVHKKRFCNRDTFAALNYKIHKKNFVFNCYATHIINLFLIQGSQPSMIKWMGCQSTIVKSF